MPVVAAPGFSDRHIGPRGDDEKALLKEVDCTSLDELVDRIVPEGIRLRSDLRLPEPATEAEALRELRQHAAKNLLRKPLIGLGYHNCIVPPVIQRNLFENPAWYTSYTPYQPEISQGRLELLFYFQTLVCELSGHAVSNASLLDEATALAEGAMVAVRRFRGRRKRIAVLGALHPQDLDVMKTRVSSLGLQLTDGPPDEETAAIVLPWPDTGGVFRHPQFAVGAARAVGALVIAVADPLALVLLEAPAAWGADIVVGSMQRFGVSMGFGGPHAAYIATSEKNVRLIPGRIVGESLDVRGNVAYRLALQTREQHIRREKATSNICTAQALLAEMSAAYAIWHGPEGLAAIAGRVHGFAARLASGARDAGILAEPGPLFDTVSLKTANSESTAQEFLRSGYQIRALDPNRVSVTFDETTTEEDLQAVANCLGFRPPGHAASMLPEGRRNSQFLSQSVFHDHRSETDMMRFLQGLAAKDLALDRTMIPLGSCTMKLNAAAEMQPVGWPEFADIHPFVPEESAQGYRKLAGDLETWLAEITGFDAVSLQPNAGSQGEYAGLAVIHQYHEARGESGRNVCLIPDSAHGTNPASAVLAGLEVVVVASQDSGEIDMKDLRVKAELHADRLAACMVTYPSTRGVFEAGIEQLCEVVHRNGGQVYLDGANLNAMAGIARPGDFGADVCHMNLHKTFCIPHGGGGPGVGPIGVKQHLAPFLPGHWTLGTSGAVSAAALGSAGILPITWMYIRMMGAKGLRRASATAMLNANYVSRRLASVFPTAFHGDGKLVAHECILDPRQFRERAGITAEDIAKRLIDYGFHAPTMEWPVLGTLMVEPTESESKAELDRFCDAMLEIAREIEQVESGFWPKENNPLVNAPHTLADALAEHWDRPYPRGLALCPPGVDPARKYLPPVARVDNVHGDRNVVCACPPVAMYDQPS